MIATKADGWMENLPGVFNEVDSDRKLTPSGWQGWSRKAEEVKAEAWIDNMIDSWGGWCWGGSCMQNISVLIKM